MVNALRSMWWATLIIGIIAVVLGLIAVLMPVAALKAIVFLIAIYALLTGTVGVIGGIRGIRHDIGGWLELLWGLFGIGLGLYVLFERQAGAVFLFLLYGIWALFRGAVEAIAAIRLRHAMSGWVVMLLAGLAWAALGVLFLVAPGAAAVATTVVWGALVMIIGVITIVAAALAHHALKDLEEQEAAAPTLMQY